MEIRLVDYDGIGGEPELVIHKTLQPGKFVILKIEDKAVKVDRLELEAAIKAVGLV